MKDNRQNQTSPSLPVTNSSETSDDVPIENKKAFSFPAKKHGIPILIFLILLILAILIGIFYAMFGSQILQF